MNGLEGLSTKTLQLLWDNIHRVSGLGEGTYFDPYTGLYCSIGATTKPMADQYHIEHEEAESLLSEGFSFQSILQENDAFDGTPEDRRIHMLQFIGSELMTRDDIEVRFREKVKLNGELLEKTSPA